MSTRSSAVSSSEAAANVDSRCLPYSFVKRSVQDNTLLQPLSGTSQSILSRGGWGLVSEGGPHFRGPFYSSPQSPVRVCSDDDTLHLPLSEDVAYGHHRYGNSHAAAPLSSRWCERAVPVGYPSQGPEQALKQAPPTKLLNYQEVLDKATIGKILQMKDQYKNTI